MESGGAQQKIVEKNESYMWNFFEGFLTMHSTITIYNLRSTFGVEVDIYLSSNKYYSYFLILVS